MTITELVTEAFTNASEKGFHEKQAEIGTMIALIHSELSEALEAHRKGMMFDKANTGILGICATESPIPCNRMFKDFVKDTFEDELADAVIRIADMCGLLGIDLESHIKAKLAYNKTRPQLHGKKY